MADLLVQLKPMRNQIILLFLLSQLLTGCTIAWRGYKAPSASNFNMLSANDKCMKIGTQNLDERQKKAVLEAASDVCGVLHSDEFKNILISKTWLSGCDTDNGKPKTISGQEVYDLLMKKIPDYSVHPRKPWLAIALTSRDTSYFSRVAIRPDRIEAWYSEDVTARAELVNTIAHETMHVISEELVDRGHGTRDCPDHKLVSYAVGNIVEALWICQHLK
jgi:hypothetical protein